MNGLKIFWLLASVACTGALIFQLGQVLIMYNSPTLTNTVVNNVDLKTKEFPFTLKICANPAFNETAISEAGYGVNGYFMGFSRQNPSLVGWAGHTNTSGGRGGVAEVLSKVRRHTINDVLKEVFISTMDGNGFLIEAVSDMLYTERVNFPHNCYTIFFNLTQHDGFVGGIKVIDLKFHDIIKSWNQSVVISLEDRSLVCNRNVGANSFYSTGDLIKLDTDNANIYTLQINKNIFVEEDSSKNCRNYPNPDFASYKECDDQWMKNIMSNLAPGLVPIWLADNMEEVTTNMTVANDRA
jgi:hypothetical protein